MKKYLWISGATTLAVVASLCPASLAQETWDVDAAYPLIDPDPCDSSAYYERTIVKGDVMITQYASEANEDIGLVVFQRNQEGTWEQTDFLEIPGVTSPYAYLVYDLTASTSSPENDRIVVSRGGGSSSSSRVYVYERNGSGNFTLYQELDDPDNNDYGFGSNVAIDNRLIVVGNPEYPGNDRGSVHVFRRISSGSWSHIKTWTGQSNNDEIGDEIGVYGNTVVYQTERSGGGNRCYLRYRNSNTDWTLIQSIYGDDLGISNFTEGGVIGDVLMILGYNEDDPESDELAFMGLFQSDGTVGQMHNINVRPEDEPAMYQRGFVSFGNEVLVMRQPEWVGQVGFEPAVDRWNLFADSEPAYGGSILFPNTSPAGYRMAYDGTSIYSFGQCELRRFGPFTADECEIPLQEAPCNADIDDNGLVNVDDLLAIIQDWGMVGEDGTRPAGDCAPLPLGDCMVNVDDLLSVIASWGSTCDEPGT